MRRLLFICLFWFCAICVSAQESRYSIDTITIYFPVNKYEYDSSYLGNKQSMEKLQSLQNINTITIKVTSSPEGRLSRNQWLSQQRARSLAEYFKANNILFESVVETLTVDEAWSELEHMVRQCDMPWRDDVLNIIESYPQVIPGDDGKIYEARKSQLIKYKNGTVWRYLIDNWFPSLRSFTVIAKINVEQPVTEVVSFTPPPVRFDAPSITQLRFDQPQPDKNLQQPWTRNLTVKTNFIGLGMGLINVAAELDIAPHWSVALPFYYSGGYDYFKSTLKFRGIVLQPEVRYYLRGNDGFYAGAHLGLGWYNYALDGEYRIQDHRGRRPALGGGIGFGYSLDFKKFPQWGLDFSLGAGIYDVKYDVFYNEPNGAYAEHGVHDIFFGIDNVSVALTYKFPIKKEDRK